MATAPAIARECPNTRHPEYQNGEVVGAYVSGEVMVNPLNALTWLANHLASHGLSLQPGDIVMSGSISNARRPSAY